MMRRALLAVLVMSLALAAPAAAKIWFQDMGGRTVHWDQQVVASIIGCAGNASCGDSVGRHMVYLRRVGATRLHRLARIDGNGRVRFTVPHLPPGRYRLVAVEAGGSFTASNAFRLRRAG